MDLINKNLKILITYGSQTGNAECISKILHKQLTEVILGVELHPLNDILEIPSFNTYDFVLVILSTTGDGEFPDNSAKFWKKMRYYKEKDLGETKYAILGLGSTDYNNFCFAAKSLNRRIRKNCAKEFFPIEFADDATDLSTVVDPWLKKIKKYLLQEQKNIQNWFIKSMTSYFK